MDKSFSEQETLNLVHAKAKELGDNFWVKVFRRRNIGAMPDAFATFADANAVHVQHPETWLPRIAGGGPTFLLSVYHAQEPTLPLGGFLQVSVPTDNYPPKGSGELDINLLKSSNWQGPRSLIWPTAEDRKAAQQPTGYSVSPPVPSAGNSAANNVPGGQAPGAGYEAQMAFARLENERNKLYDMRAELEHQKRQMELDNIRRENDTRMHDLEVSMKMASSAPKTNTAETIAAVLAAASPIIQQMMVGQNELRLAMMKQQDESTRQMQAQQAAAQLQQQQMFQLMLARPSVDPVVEKALDRMQVFIEKSRGEAVPQGQMLHSMAEAMGVMTDVTMNLVQTAAELNLGGNGRDEHPALKAVKQGVKAISSLMEGYQQSVMQKQTQFTGQPQPQLSSEVARFQQQAVQPVQQYQPQPVPQPVASQAPAPQQPAKQPDALDLLEAAIRAKQPTAQVAKQFIDSLGDPVVQKALDEVNGEVNELVARRIGGWVMADPSNVAYLKALMDEVNAQGEAAGVFEPEDDDDNDDDDDDDGGDSGED